MNCILDQTDILGYIKYETLDCGGKTAALSKAEEMTNH